MAHTRIEVVREQLMGKKPPPRKYGILCALECVHPHGSHYDALYWAVKSRFGPISRDDFDKDLRELRKEGYVEKENYHYGKYKITTNGVDALCRPPPPMGCAADLRDRKTHYFNQAAGSVSLSGTIVYPSLGSLGTSLFQVRPGSVLLCLPYSIVERGGEAMLIARIRRACGTAFVDYESQTFPQGVVSAPN